MGRNHITSKVGIQGATDGSAIMRKLRLEAHRRMERACAYLVGELQYTLNTGQPVRRSASGRLIGLDPSKPGEPPRLLTGSLKQSITHKIDVDLNPLKGGTIVGTVGTSIPYARRLEFGFYGVDDRGRTIHQEPRPFLRSTLDRRRQEVAAILTKDLPSRTSGGS